MAPWGITSALYQSAGQEIIDEATKQFHRTKLGRAHRQIEQAMKRSQAMQKTAAGTQAASHFSAAMQGFAKGGLEVALQALQGTMLGDLIHGIERYSKGSKQSLLGEFFKQMGPAGEYIQSLLEGKPYGTNKGVERLINLTEALGFPVLRPGASRSKSQLEAMAEELRLHGYTVQRPGQENLPSKSRPPHSTIVGVGVAPRHEEQPIMVDGNLYEPSDAMLTGEFIKSPQSSNVHSFAYSLGQRALFVRFCRGKPPGAKTRTKGPGSLYRYEGVTPAEFNSIRAANSKGGWVWDHLRIRGTMSGHQKAYALVGIVGNYVPRQATYGRQFAGGPIQEQFAPRRIWGADGQWHESSLGPQWLPDNGAPFSGHTAAPNNGSPNTGAP